MNIGDACFDLRARESCEIASGETYTVPLGIQTEIPFGYHAAVSMRSGLARKGLLLSNAPGIIDSYYRDEWGAIIFNSSNKLFSIRKGDRIAQFRILKTLECKLEQVDNVSREKDRGGGFGSTGWCGTLSGDLGWASGYGQ